LAVHLSFISRHGVRLNEHLEHLEGDVALRHAGKMGWKDHLGALRTALAFPLIVPAGTNPFDLGPRSPDWSKSPSKTLITHSSRWDAYARP
jgi:hypothetical protein